MTPRGAAPLIEMRKGGMRPASPVWINLGDFRDPDWWLYANSATHPEIVVRPEDPIDRLDLRCVFGLDVTLFFPDYSDRAAMLYEKLQGYAAEILVLSPDFDDDIGFWWLPKYGQLDYGNRHIVTAYENARANCMAAAYKRNDAAYRVAQAEELRLLEEAPWLR